MRGLQAVRNAAGCITFGTGCSGTDVCSHAFRVLSRLWSHQYGIHSEPRHLVSAEIVEWKR
eukprot:3521776-Alexandrium_andersonii.AAC.1